MAEAVLTRRQAAKIRAQGVKVDFLRNNKGQTVSEQAALQAQSGLHGLALLGPARRHPRRAGRNRSREPAARQARGPREDPSGTRPDRAEGHSGRPGRAGRITAGGPLLVEPARARMDQPRGEPAPAAALHPALAGERQGDQGPPQAHRAVVRHLGEPRWLPVLVRRRTSLAEEPARQQRRRADRHRRRRRSQPQLQRSLGVRRRGLVARSLRRDVPRTRPRVRARDAGDAGPDRPHQAEVPVQHALLR